jgi:hypothetical protein
MEISKLARVPSRNKTYSLLRQLGEELAPANIQLDILSAAREADGLKKRKEFRIYKQMLNTLIMMEEHIAEADVPEVGPAYQSIRKLVDVFGEMEVD